MFSTSASAQFHFSTGEVDGQIGTGARPSSSIGFQIETGDDFNLTQSIAINHATFTGLLPASSSLSSIKNVTVELYHVFPVDSNATRTRQVPTRMNSPSDIDFADRASSDGSLTFTASLLNPSFTVSNSLVNGLNVGAGGEGPVTGEEVLIDVNFTTPFSLPADHYFFVPGVTLSDGTFLWLSSVRPIVPPGTLFAPDLQSWIRNDPLEPDWLRIGTDIVGGGKTFNAAFSLDGTPVPEPATTGLMGVGVLALALLVRNQCRTVRSSRFNTLNDGRTRAKREKAPVGPDESST
jgi:hypothetical protein